jgi:ABC-type sugar transport system, periplasmic component
MLRHLEKLAGPIVIAASLFWALAPAALAQQVHLQVAIADPGKTPIADLEEMVAAFEAEHPNITIEIVNDYGNSFDRLATHIAGGVAPDILHFYNETPILAMENGFLLDLTPYLEREGQEILGDLLPLVLAQVSREGSVYGLPFQTSATGAIYYNRVMFDQAGLAHPDGSWDWEEFASSARRLTRSDGTQITQIGLAIAPTGWLWLFPWLVQSGVSFEDPYRVPLDTPEAIRAFEYLRTWIDQEAFGWSNTRGTFPEQTAAMNFSGSWELTIWANNQIPMGVAEAPSGPAGKATLTNTNIIAINRFTEHPDEAWEFIKWLYSREAQLEYVRRFGMQPVLLSLGYDWVEIVHERIRASGHPEVPGIEAFITSSAFAIPQPIFANSAVIVQYIQPAIAQIMTENVAIAPTMEAMVQAAEAFLREGN